jgi:hypothetical protein
MEGIGEGEAEMVEIASGARPAAVVTGVHTPAGRSVPRGLARAGYRVCPLTTAGLGLALLPSMFGTQTDTLGFSMSNQFAARANGIGRARGPAVPAHALVLMRSFEDKGKCRPGKRARQIRMSPSC